MKKWLPLATVGLGCLVVGWMGGRFHSARSESPEFAISATPEDMPTLVRRAHALWQASPDRVDGRQVLQFMSHLARTMDDGAWWAVSAPMAQAWERQHDSESLQGALASANEVIVPRFIRTGSVDELSRMIGKIHANSFDSNQLSGMIEKALAEPLPADGFRGSRPEQLVAATVRAGDLPRARSYLGRLVWPPNAPAETRKSLEPVREAIEIGLQSVEGALDIHRVIRAWHANADGPLERSCFQPSLEDIALSTVVPSDRKAAATRVDELFRQSAGDPGAEAFWERILYRLRPTLIRSGEGSSVDAALLVRAFAERYKKVDVEYAFWRNAGDTSWRWVPDDPRRAARFYRRALTAATSEPERVEAVRRFAFQCQRANDPEPALLLVRQVADGLRDPAARNDLGTLTEELMQSTLKSNSAAAARKQADRDRQNQVLERMKALLAKARQEKRPEEEIQALQAVIRDVEAQLQE
jgi:hypothetical protein